MDIAGTGQMFKNEVYNNSYEFIALLVERDIYEVSWSDKDEHPVAGANGQEDDVIDKTDVLLYEGQEFKNFVP